MICRLSAKVTVGVGARTVLIDWLTSLGASLRRLSPFRGLARSDASLTVLSLVCSGRPGLVGSFSGVVPFSLAVVLRFCCFSKVTLRTPIYLFQFEITSLANDNTWDSY
jgi:hypothetical protein